jgi:hypothetical protein
MRLLALARNPYSLLRLWIPGSLALLAPRNDEQQESPVTSTGLLNI